MWTFYSLKSFCNGQNWTCLILLEWIEKAKTEKHAEKIETFNSVGEIFINYTQDSTIQGIIYIFFPYQVM